MNKWRWKDDDENPGGKQDPDGDAKWERKPLSLLKCLAIATVSPDKNRGFRTSETALFLIFGYFFDDNWLAGFGYVNPDNFHVFIQF